jgi:hypothetical protein
MPVRIVSVSDPSTFAVTADEVQEGIDHFNEHYTVSSFSEYEGALYYVNWKQFRDCVRNYQLEFPSVEEENIAIRFVHAFSTVDNTLYMRMQICEMLLTTITIHSSPTYEILDNGNSVWYDVKPDSITPTANTSTTDEEYLEAFVYMPTGTTAVTESLAEDGGFRFVRVLSYPWKNEILQLYVDNDEPDENQTQIYFASASYTESLPGSTNVQWPHGLVMYLAVAYEPMLDNDNYVSMFHYKGADMGTACPPDCNVYIAPNPTLYAQVPK